MCWAKKVARFEALCDGAVREWLEIGSVCFILVKPKLNLRREVFLGLKQQNTVSICVFLFGRFYSCCVLVGSERYAKVLGLFFLFKSKNPVVPKKYVGIYLKPH